MTTLALQYRPRLLSDLVGQEASVHALTNALKRAQISGRIHHQAFLFAGVRGTGKTSTARILARALNCIHGPTATPCGVCDPCKASEQPDTNLDIVEIDAASRASVEDARALREQVQTRPAFCRYRVYIIDEVHMLSRQAFDALLKVLEEPPAHAVFVLATTEFQDVPDTIKSRVQIYPFRLIPVGLIEGRLQQVCGFEGVSFEPHSLRLVAEAGQGSMRDALTTLDRVIAAGDGHVREDVVREQLGIVPAVRVQGVLDALNAGDTTAILDHCQALTSLGADWISFWRELMLAFRDRLESETRQDPSPQKLLRSARVLQLLLQRERDLRDSSLPQVVVELALLTAAQLPHLAPLDGLVSGTSAVLGPRPAVQAPGGAMQPEHPNSNASKTTAAAAPTIPTTPPPVPSAVPAKKALPTAAPAALESPIKRAQGQGIGAITAIAAIAPTAAIKNPSDANALRAGVSDALKSSSGGLPPSLASLPHLAADLRWVSPVLRWRFPNTAQNAVQELERERTNPHLLEALANLLPGLTSIEIHFEESATERPEDQLRREPAFQSLLQASGGEILDVKREPKA
ncbi:MAG: DNA polymerase III subunit gamma/tau [Holophagaceae bacterium]|nr:DNA polymerase III subunit gamma/tau [Holophagaceae bacterium]